MLTKEFTEHCLNLFDKTLELYSIVEVDDLVKATIGIFYPDLTETEAVETMDQFGINPTMILIMILCLIGCYYLRVY